MANANPLQKFFRQPSVYVKLPSKGYWYKNGTVELSSEGEVAIYPMSALDDILLNTPDAMLNGQALEKVIKNCVPDVKNIKELLLPDLESIFVGIKAASSDGKAEYEKKCPECNHENLYELNCSNLLDRSTFIDEDNTFLKFGEDLIIFIKPYDFEMRQLFIKKEFEEEKFLRSIDKESEKSNLDELQRADILGKSVERLSKMTFELVSRSIDKIKIVQSGEEVSDREEISQFLSNISKDQADIIITAVNNLNATGVPKEIPVTCSNCAVQWTETLSFDPSSFFGKRS